LEDVLLSKEGQEVREVFRLNSVDIRVHRQSRVLFH
jgi:hypothetical protein